MAAVVINSLVEVAAVIVDGLAEVAAAVVDGLAGIDDPMLLGRSRSCRLVVLVYILPLKLPPYARSIASKGATRM